MELKLTVTEQLRNQFLLIVPYGIETFTNTLERGRHGLLIVPYGIET